MRRKLADAEVAEQDVDLQPCHTARSISDMLDHTFVACMSSNHKTAVQELQGAQLQAVHICVTCIT